jgi:Spy/CpxP family protein refolding chaperone
MRKTRIEILLIALTVLAMGAGLAAGLLAARLPASAGTSTGSPGTSTPTDVSPPAPPPSAGDRTPLVEELGLTPEQRDQMREIWETTRSHVHQTFQDAQRLQKDRDDALVALLNDEQKAKFQKISKDYAARFEQLVNKRDQEFEEAVQKTKAILTETQRQKYEEILRRHVGPDGPGARRGPATGALAPDIRGGAAGKEGGEK